MVISSPTPVCEAPLPSRVKWRAGVRLLALFITCFTGRALLGQVTDPSFAVATVRPAPPGTDPSTGTWSRPGSDRFTATHVSLALLLKLAYGIDDSQISHKPAWLETSLYDVVATADNGVNLTREELRPRLQRLLNERFHLVAHTEGSFQRGYALVIATGGPHLTATKGDHFPGFRINVSPGEMRGANWTMAQLASYLTPAAGFPVEDQTGIKGSYDIAFSYAPSDTASNGAPELGEALKRATGLTLKSRKIPVELLVIDSAEETPTAN